MLCMTPEPVFILSNLDSWLESSCHDFWPQMWDKWPLTTIYSYRVWNRRINLTMERLIALLSIMLPDMPLNRRQRSQLVPSIQSLIFIELFPSFDIYFVPGSGLCISICCQNLWFSDKNCILKQSEEKLLKLHFTVCQMMFYKRMNLCVLREFCFYSVIIKFPLRYSLDVKCKNVKLILLFSKSSFCLL